MFGKRSGFLLLMIFHSVFCLAAQTAPPVQFLSRSAVYPYFYESLLGLQSFGSSQQFKVFFFITPRIGLGPAGNVSYFSFDGEHQLTGSFLAAVQSAAFLLTPVRWVSIEAGAGGGWMKTAFNYQQRGWINHHYGLMRLELNGYFQFPFPYIALNIRSAGDIMIHQYPGVFFTGTAELVIHPYYSWIDLFHEAGVMVFSYTDPAVSFTRPAFIWSAGIAFHPDFPETGRILNEDRRRLAALREKRITDLEKKRSVEPDPVQDQLNRLEKSSAQEFFDIQFDSSTGQIDPASSPVLQKLADFMKARPDYRFQLTGNSEFQGSPTQEIRESMEKVKKIRAFLESLGVNPEQILINSSANLYIKKDQYRPGSVMIEMIRKSD